MKIQKLTVSCNSKTTVYIFSFYWLVINILSDSYLKYFEYVSLFQDNVFVTVLAAVHYGVLDVADDNSAKKAFYVHSDPKSLIEDYAFDGKWAIDIIITCVFINVND